MYQLMVIKLLQNVDGYMQWTYTYHVKSKEIDLSYGFTDGLLVKAYKRLEFKF